MQKLQDSVFTIIKSTNLSPAVFSFLQPTEEFTDKTPLGGILKDTKHGWLALGPKFCVVDLKSGLKVAARTFGSGMSHSHISVTSVVELPTPLTENSHQLIISLDFNNESGMICILHVNGSQMLRCIQTEMVITELSVCDSTPDGPFTAFNNIVIAGTKKGELLIFDLNRASLIQALKDISQGYEHMVLNEDNASNIKLLPLKNLHQIEEQRDLALENNDHLGIILNEDSLFDGQYIFRNPDGTVRMKAKQDHIRVTSLQYIPQLGSLAIGFNFGAFQLWNLLNLDLEFTSQVNVECLPVTHFGFQEPCDDPRAFCYLWVVFSVIDRFEEEEFPLAVMYSLTYQGKRMLSDTKCLYQDFSSATIRFQVELSASEDVNYILGGRCVSCHTYSISSPLGDEGEDSMLNICQLVWECWGEQSRSAAQYGMLLFDLDQWYKDQMPATYRLESNAFMSVTWLAALGTGPLSLDARLQESSVAPYSHATRLEEHFYPNSLQYNCICLNTSEANILGTVGVQRQIINSIDNAGPTALLSPGRLYHACVTAGLTPLYVDTYIHSYGRTVTQEEQRRFLLSVALEARLSRFLKRCAHDWATGTHSGLGCTLGFLVDWSWKRAIELKENAKELAGPLFTSSTMPDKNIVRCLEHCVQQLSQLTGLLDAILTKCCNLVVPDALSEMEEKYKGIGTVSLYFQVVQWFLRVGLLPERHDAFEALPYPAQQLYGIYKKRRLKLHRLQENTPQNEDSAHRSCTLLYIDQLLEHEFGGERIHEMWIKGGSETGGMYPPPSLYSLLRLYLLPDIAEEHKHSLVLYLLLDYSMVYDEIRYEAVIRRLMQFPTMFGLSNTSIKATQAFWHLDHRDFDFALDQLQCLTGNTLSDWQHSVVLSSLLAQKKTQAALQYLHVRKPAPMQSPMRTKDGDIVNYSRINDHDKLDDWQTCCNLYLARGLVFEALDVIRMCVQNAGSSDNKVQVLNFFYKGCRNTGQLAKILQVTLQPSEEEVFIKYIKDCNDPQMSDILIMYYLQHARYLEAEEYNNKLKEQRGRTKEMSTSAESLADLVERSDTRDTLLSAACAALPTIACRVASTANMQLEPHVIVPKPMSVYVKALSPKNTFSYKSSFIQDTIENASGTWINKPKMRKALKRVLEIEETPFICTPKLIRTKSIFSEEQTSTDATPAKRTKFDISSSPKTPKPGVYKASHKLSAQMATLLDMPEVQSPSYKYNERSGAGTPHSILKTRRNDASEREVAVSPVDSRYLCDSEDELLETGSNATHYSDSKHLRFTIPSGSESGSCPSSPVAIAIRPPITEKDPSETGEDVQDEVHPMESPPKKLATEGISLSKKTYKDSVRARRSLSISANSSLSDDPNASIESIADISITLINPGYSGKKLNLLQCSIEKQEKPSSVTEDHTEVKASVRDLRPIPNTPKGRKSIRQIGGESTPLLTKRATSVTPERQDSPLMAFRTNRSTRSRSRTPELSPNSSLAPIPEQPKQEVESEPHPAKTSLSIPRRRSRSRTPDTIERSVVEPPKLESITELPVKSSGSDSPASPTRRSLRSRSRTPEVEVDVEQPDVSPRSMRSRSKTPEKLMSPKKDNTAKGRKPLSRLVLEANAFAKTKQFADKIELESEKENQKKSDGVIECTPMKADKLTSLMDFTFSPIVNKSILQSSTESFSSSEKTMQVDESSSDLKPFPAFTSIDEVNFQKSILHSYESSIIQSSSQVQEKSKMSETSISKIEMKSLPTLISENETDFNKSVLKSDDSAAFNDTVPKGDKEGKKTSDNIEKVIGNFETLQEIDFNKSILKSHESSVVESSQEVNTCKAEKSELKDMSSLVTSDSDIEVTEEPKWKYKIDNENTASVIQKEKEKIVEIEREINEIEQDMSVGEENSDEEYAQDDDDEESIESSETSAEEHSDDGTSNSDNSEEIIYVKDSDSEPESINLLIVEETSTKSSDVDQANVYSQTEKIIEMEVETITNKEMEVETITNKEMEVETITNKEMEVETIINKEMEVETITNKEIETETENICEKSEKVTEFNKEISNKNKGDVIIQEEIIEIKETNITLESSSNVLNQANISLLTDDNSTITSDINLTYSDEIDNNQVIKEVAEIDPEKELPPRPLEVLTKETALINDDEKENADVVDSKKLDIESSPDKMETEIDTFELNQEKTAIDDNTTDTEPKESKISRKRTKSTLDKTVKDSPEKDEEKPIQPRTPGTRKRSQSRSSSKSTTKTQKEAPQTEDQPSDDTPSKKQIETSKRELRVIITRRASKESEKGEEIDTVPQDDNLTPRRRSNRLRSKNMDDSASVVSKSSIKSTQSKASEDVLDIRPATRKGRKSILNTKTELSAIPETAVEDLNMNKDEVLGVVGEYRLTRNQKSVLESWMQPIAPRRRTSVASRSEASVDDDALSETSTIDRVDLLDREEYEGPPDHEEFHRASPVLLVSESVRPRARLARAASETKTVTKPSKVTRSTSVDIAATNELSSPVQAGGLRGRRASFNRACEALHTPKGRRTSTDSRKSDAESVASAGTPRASTSKQRPRRASTQLTPIATPDTDVGKRFRKAVEK